MKDNFWAPLRETAYRNFWICAFLSNLGTWVQDVASGWVLTHLNTSPLVISLLSFSNSLPILLFAIPAGVIADFGFRRQLLIFSQVVMFLGAGILGLLVLKHNISEWSLLLLTLLMGIGFAISNPAFQSVLTDLVPGHLSIQAVLVYYMGINLTRVLGPSLGGFLLGTLGPGSSFLFNSLSFLGMIFFYIKWPLTGSEEKAVAIHTDDFKRLLNSASFRLWAEIFCVTFFASALWALYPTRGRIEMQLNSWQYGSLLGSLGAGACLSAIFSKKIFKENEGRFSWSLAYLIYSLGVLLLGFATEYWMICASMFLAGMGWLVFTTLMNMQARDFSKTSKLKATQLAVFLSVFYAGMAAGAVSWGWLAKNSSTTFSLTFAGAILLLLSLIKWLLYRRSPHIALVAVD